MATDDKCLEISTVTDPYGKYRLALPYKVTTYIKNQVKNENDVYEMVSRFQYDFHLVCFKSILAGTFWHNT